MSTLKINTVEEARSIFDEIKRNDLMNQKYRKKCKYLSYVEHLTILVSTVTCCVSISPFGSLDCVPAGLQDLQ